MLGDGWGEDDGIQRGDGPQPNAQPARSAATLSSR